MNVSMVEFTLEQGVKSLPGERSSQAELPVCKHVCKCISQGGGTCKKTPTWLGPGVKK